ncbi:MAG: hypothetical protein EA397_14485 [Deltaproteobacteria bacterium]|nr:MAG: hypothetical protein EA397_14485 [Deltaproteobacteria bacterium]
MRTLCLLLLAVACGPVEASIIPVDGRSTPNDDSEDSLSSSDEDRSTEGLPISSWTGSREVQRGRCSGVLQEVGVRYTFGEQADACTGCDYVFELEVSPARICNLDVVTPTWRGVTVSGETATIWSIEPLEGGGWQASALASDAQVRSEAGQVLLDYSYSLGAVSITGEAVLGSD